MNVQKVNDKVNPSFSAKLRVKGYSALSKETRNCLKEMAKPIGSENDMITIDLSRIAKDTKREFSVVATIKDVKIRTNNAIAKIKNFKIRTDNFSLNKNGSVNSTLPDVMSDYFKFLNNTLKSRIFIK